ncbi:MAG: PEP-CTERM system TPR-repeat protein PrsT [Thalassotalea sp.]|nr:PEP-CTERM system TPR-repeat protein PrsT [Thalassotalea sp.]
MKNITKQLLIPLASLTFVVGCGQPESANQYISDAKEQLAKENITTSIIALKNAIQIEPNNGEARYLLGKIYLEDGNRVNAIKELERALQNKYDISLVAPLLTEAYYLNEDFINIIEFDIAGLSPAAKIKVSFFQILANVMTGASEQAQELLKKLNKEEGNKGYYQLAKAYLTFAEQDLEGARSLVEEALSSLPANPHGVLLLGHIGAAKRDFSMASENYAKYLSLLPGQRSVELMLANSLLQQGKLVEAEQHADSILALLPEQAFANYIKAMVRVEEKDYVNASKHAELALANKLNQPNIRLVAGVSAFYLKNYEQALNHLKSLASFLPEDHFARKMLVVSQLELGLIEDAATMAEELTAASPENTDFYSSLSYRLLQAGATNEAKAVLAKQGQVQTEDASKLLKDGILRMMVDDDEALTSLEKAVELDPELAKAELALAYLAVRSGDTARALSIATKWQESYPEKADGYNLESAIALKRKDLSLAKKLLLQGLKIESDNLYSLTQLAQISQAEGDNDAAQDYIQKAITAAPYDLKVLRLYFRLLRNEEALQTLKDKLTQAPANDNLKIVVAEAQLSMGELESAIGLLNQITPNIDTPKLFWMMKVYTAKASKNIVMLKKALDDWSELNPYHIEPSFYLAEYYVYEKDFKRALNTVDEALKRHPEYLTLSFVKTEILLDMRKAADAKAFYESYKSRVDDLPAKYGIEGRIALLNKQFSLAAENLATFYKSQPNNKMVTLLAAALIGNSEQAQAIELLEGHIATMGGNSQVYSLLGTLQLQANNREGALKVYEAMIEEQPTNVIAINNAAWLNMEQGDFDRALTLINQAVDLAPNNAQVLDTKAMVLLKSGKAVLAWETSEKAILLYRNKPINNDLALNYAEILLANEQFDKARSFLNNLVITTPEDIARRNNLLESIK